ncbi:hypothetical protein ACE1AT_16680 [Pelatocladus sp. BLCC-F211]|uniref:hypothetical protein n=1 Tax=Pelatocladus sp. BLCC-F211 TaxID=3342752 RepID=UPI0035BB5D93
MKIYAPNIHLFAFQLYKPANLEEINADEQNKLWHGADAIVKTILHTDLNLSQNIDVSKNSDSPRVDLLKESAVKDGNHSLPFENKISVDHQQDVMIKGFAYPVQLHDSYGLSLNLRRPEKEADGTPSVDLDISFLSNLNPHNCLTLSPNKLFLGQTLLITAWLTGAKDKKYLYEIAESCLQAVFADAKQRPSFHRQGELFGSPIFEYGLFSELANYQHVLIWLFVDEQADEKFGLIYSELLDLFFFRTKVVKAYQDSRKTYYLLDEQYKNIERQLDKLSNQKIDNLNQKDLNELTEKLKYLAELAVKYTRLLRNLEDYQNTIAINSENYHDRLQQISSKTQQADLSFLETFYHKISALFQKQINFDLGYFKHGTGLLEQVISSIRGIVEIEQAKRDRSLEQTIQIIGVALGGGVIVSGVVTQHIDKPFAPISVKNPPHPMILSLFWSFVAIAFLWWVARWWTNRK